MTWIGRLPWGLIGTLALIVGVEGLFLAPREADFKTGWHWEWTVNGRAARSSRARGFPIVCFGDSQVNHGVIPLVLERTTGLKTLNLALSGGQATTSYFQLRRVIEAGAKPEAVVVDFFPLLLNHGYLENEARWPDLLTPGELWELARAIGEPDFLGRTALAKLLVSVRERAGIRKAVTLALDGIRHTERHEAEAQRRNWRLNSGGLVFDRNPAMNLGDLDAWYRAAFPYPGWIRPYHATYLKKFLGLADLNGLRVFWVVPPLPPEVQAKFTERGQDDRFDRLARSVLDRYPNVTILDARTSGYPREVFVDHGHLDRVGARTFTVDVGEALGKARGGDPARWVRLPRFRALAEEPPVEDIGQSRRMIVERIKATATR